MTAIKNRPVGGYKRKAWRLKKKYDKRFRKLVIAFIEIALEEMPDKIMEDCFRLQDYEFVRCYGKD